MGCGLNAYLLSERVVTLRSFFLGAVFWLVDVWRLRMWVESLALGVWAELLGWCLRC